MGPTEVPLRRRRHRDHCLTEIMEHSFSSSLTIWYPWIPENSNHSGLNLLSAPRFFPGKDSTRSLFNHSWKPNQDRNVMSFSSRRLHPYFRAVLGKLAFCDIFLPKVEVAIRRQVYRMPSFDRRWIPVVVDWPGSTRYARPSTMCIRSALMPGLIQKVMPGSIW